MVPLKAVVRNEGEIIVPPFRKSLTSAHGKFGYYFFSVPWALSELCSYPHKMDTSFQLN